MNQTRKLDMWSIIIGKSQINKCLRPCVRTIIRATKRQNGILSQTQSFDANKTNGFANLKLPSNTVEFTTRCGTKIMLVKPCRTTLAPPSGHAPRVPNIVTDMTCRQKVINPLFLFWRSDNSGLWEINVSGTMKKIRESNPKHVIMLVHFRVI